MGTITNFLIKKFIKNHENILDKEVRAQYGFLGGAVGICANLLLFIIKILIGVFSKSVAITTDAFNNLSDLGNSVITIIGAGISKMPPDKEHPFGHGRMEYICAFGISFVIMYAGIEFLKASFSKILDPKPIIFNFYIVLILVFSILIKFWMGIFNRKISKKIKSEALKAVSLDSLIDCLVTLSTIISGLVFHYFGINIDGLIGVLISSLVIWGGFCVFKDALSPLLGESADSETKRVINEILLSRDEICSVHDLMVHHYGPSRKIATIHVVVDSESDIWHIHEIIDEAEREIFEKLNIECIIHVDPVSTQCEKTLEIEKLVLGFLKSMDDKLDMHDFRIKNSQDKTVVFFDLQVPSKYKDKEVKELVEKIKGKLKELNFDVIINIDPDFD
ncbi:MAG: cation transporter [Clostridiaceae bacterium]|nr:cation transporter [Clostridiaceae bacterium]